VKFLKLSVLSAFLLISGNLIAKESNKQNEEDSLSVVVDAANNEVVEACVTSAHLEPNSLIN